MDQNGYLLPIPRLKLGFGRSALPRPEGSPYGAVGGAAEGGPAQLIASHLADDLLPPVAEHPEDAVARRCLTSPLS